MQVYVLMGHVDYEGAEVVGVFLTREAAHEYQFVHQEAVRTYNRDMDAMYRDEMDRDDFYALHAEDPGMEFDFYTVVEHVVRT